MKGKQRELFSDINITPLTDVFLVLLIIMMVVAPLLEYRGIDMNVSVDDTAEPPKNDEEVKHVRVAIAADGNYQVDGQAVPFQDLVPAIQKGLVEKPEGVVIETDPEANHAALTHAIDAAQVSGVKDVRVIEAAPPAPEPPPEAPAAKSKKPRQK